MESRIRWRFWRMSPDPVTYGNRCSPRQPRAPSHCSQRASIWKNSPRASKPRCRASSPPRTAKPPHGRRRWSGNVTALWANSILSFLPIWSASPRSVNWRPGAPTRKAKRRSWRWTIWPRSAPPSLAWSTTSSSTSRVSYWPSATTSTLRAAMTASMTCSLRKPGCATSSRSRRDKSHRIVGSPWGACWQLREESPFSFPGAVRCLNTSCPFWSCPRMKIRCWTRPARLPSTGRLNTGRSGAFRGASPSRGTTPSTFISIISTAPSACLASASSGGSPKIW